MQSKTHGAANLHFPVAKNGRVPSSCELRTWRPLRDVIPREVEGKRGEKKPTQERTDGRHASEKTETASSKFLCDSSSSHTAPGHFVACACMCTVLAVAARSVKLSLPSSPI